jgi:hypothetical protein
MSGISALYFFGEVPRVRQDILVHIPVIGSYWERSVPPEDNVSKSSRAPCAYFDVGENRC